MKIVLLPGLDGTGNLFQPFIESLPVEFEACVISYPLNKELSYEALIRLVLKQLPEEAFILLAESFSGYIAYQIVLRRPANLKSVFFVATFLENPRPLLLYWMDYLPMHWLLSATIPDYIVKSFVLGSSVNQKMIDLFKCSMQQVLPKVLCYRLQEIAKLPHCYPYPACKIKITYIQATADNLVPKRCLDSFYEVFRNIKVFQIEASHFVLQVNPLACVEIIVNESV